MRQASNGFWQGVAVGAAGGLIGTVLLENISSRLYQRENPEAKRREDGLRSDGDPAMQLARRISDEVLRLHFRRKTEKLAMGIHYAFGVMGGALFAALAPRAPFLSTGLGTLYGTLFWLIADEIGMPVMGISEPSQDYPWQTHARAWAAHVGYGASRFGFFVKLSSPREAFAHNRRSQWESKLRFSRSPAECSARRRKSFFRRTESRFRNATLSPTPARSTSLRNSAT